MFIIHLLPWDRIVVRDLFICSVFCCYVVFFRVPQALFKCSRRPRSCFVNGVSSFFSGTIMFRPCRSQALGSLSCVSPSALLAGCWYVLGRRVNMRNGSWRRVVEKGLCSTYTCICSVLLLWMMACHRGDLNRKAGEIDR